MVKRLRGQPGRVSCVIESLSSLPFSSLLFCLPFISSPLAIAFVTETRRERRKKKEVIAFVYPTRFPITFLPARTVMHNLSRFSNASKMLTEHFHFVQINFKFQTCLSYTLHYHLIQILSYFIFFTDKSA